MEAAKEWGPFGTRVVGLDLVDVLSDQAKACEYFDFQRGNLCVSISYTCCVFD